MSQSRFLPKQTNRLRRPNARDASGHSFETSYAADRCHDDVKSLHTKFSRGKCMAEFVQDHTKKYTEDNTNRNQNLPCIKTTTACFKCNP
jgi:hypothetical protein